jgi:predicted alpha-1,6-mannanase (GH76 family)
MNYFTELETLAWEQNEGDGVLFLSLFFKLLPLVLEAGAGEEEANCDVDAFVCRFLISLSSSLPLFSKKERKKRSGSCCSQLQKTMTV